MFLQSNKFTDENLWKVHAMLFLLFCCHKWPAINTQDFCGEFHACPRNQRKTHDVIVWAKWAFWHSYNLKRHVGKPTANCSCSGWHWWGMTTDQMHVVLQWTNVGVPILANLVFDFINFLKMARHAQSGYPKLFFKQSRIKTTFLNMNNIFWRSECHWWFSNFPCARVVLGVDCMHVLWFWPTWTLSAFLVCQVGAHAPMRQIGLTCTIGKL